ncbi:hypothetical protein N7495_001997 [Penicillium taxi]|uniref:uncharacterized protein n=1 Tax=Penicillium taxi TaxID=168475 RepID=UPI00254586AE|nr:uncharacterized protein N7495_001997 [Penicillium taxi]KAJ5901469.1 hypothetical protein N7495_001997 [Penicillium taxi]
MGSNSRQAALRYELGEDHSYDFVNGPIPWEMDRELDQFVMGEEQTYAMCDPLSALSCIQAMENLENYIVAEGPYDGIMGFSQGANLSLSWMIKKQQEAKNGKEKQLPFKFGVFFSNPWGVYNAKALADGQLVYLDNRTIEGLLDLPTAHIWGLADKDQALAQMISTTCVESKRSIFVHDRGHEIPPKIDTVISMAKIINRAIMQAQSMEF